MPATDRMLRRKRTMARTYLLLLWLCAVQCCLKLANCLAELVQLPLTVLYKLITLNYAMRLLRAAASQFQFSTGRSRRRRRRRSSTPRRAVVIFTRLPTPGRVKSRLIPHIGPSNAALTMRLLTENMVRRMQSMRSNVDLYLAYKDQCHVVCEPTHCNRPVQFWMEAIDQHGEFRLVYRRQRDNEEEGEATRSLNKLKRRTVGAVDDFVLSAAGANCHEEKEKEEEEENEKLKLKLKLENGVGESNGDGDSSESKVLHSPIERLDSIRADRDRRDRSKFLVSDALEYGKFDERLAQLKRRPPYEYSSVGAYLQAEGFAGSIFPQGQP